MYHPCKTEQSLARQRGLTRGLLELMEKVPYEKISVSDLCDYLKICRKTFYRYFPSKEDALYALVDQALMGQSVTAVSGYEDRGTATLEDLTRFFTYWAGQRQLLDVLCRNDLGGTLFHRAAFLSMSEMGMLHKHIAHLDRPTQDTIISFYVGGLISMLLHWHSQDYSLTPEQMAQIALRMVGTPF